MNRKILSFALAVLIALPVDLSAGELGRVRKRRSSVENFFALTFSGGYSSLMTQDKIAKPYGFIGGSVGMGYEMHAAGGGFWLSVAGEAQCMTSSIAIDKGLVEQAAADKGVAASYDIARWRDCPHYLFVSFPLLLGYRTDEFYIGVGLKLMLCAYARSISYIHYTASGESYSTDANAVLRNNLVNAAACFEIGGTLLDHSGGGRSRTRRRSSGSAGVALKLGFYAEYGFLNVNKSSVSRSVVAIDNDENRTLSIVPLFTSNSMTNATVNPLYAGVKLTLLYGH